MLAENLRSLKRVFLTPANRQINAADPLWKQFGTAGLSGIRFMTDEVLLSLTFRITEKTVSDPQSKENIQIAAAMLLMGMMVLNVVDTAMSARNIAQNMTTHQ